MKSLLKMTNMLSCGFLLIILSIGACKKQDSPPTLPTVTTNDVSNVSDISADVSGSISSAGSTDITAAGFCYSFTNATPVIGDDTVRVNATSGVFSSTLTKLQSSKNYYVRAFAINSVGTAYGEVKTFSTGNGAPVALNVAVNGTVRVAEKLTAAYTYDDAEDEAQGTTRFQWYAANNGSGDGEVAIKDATDSTYTLKGEDEFKSIRVGIKAVALTGNTIGREVKSAFVGPVAEPATTVTFNYNGASVTYGVVVSPVTGRRWLDRNLGAPNTPSAQDDYANYGDLFQWGRKDDGHQLVFRNAATRTTTGISTTTNVLADSNTPGNQYILAPDPFDWRSPKNDNLWQGNNGINNPCPIGWHVPTGSEWAAEQLTTNFDGNYAQLKITRTGYRRANREGFGSDLNGGFYQTQTRTGTACTLVLISSLEANIADYGGRAQGCAVRCIKNL